jgi:hypothetical protein
MDTDSNVDPTKCLDLNLMLLRLGSVFPFDKFSSSTWINILYKCYISVTVIFYLVLTALSPLYIFGKEYPLDEGIEVISITVTQIRSAMNFVTFVIYRKEIQNLILSLHKNFYIHSRNLSIEESCAVREAIEHARKMTTAHFSLYSITGLIMILHPVTAPTPADLDQENAFNHTKGPHRILPFKTWYPYWDTTKSPQYEIEYFVQATLTALEAWCVSSTDTFCVSLMIYVGCQFDLLGLSLKNTKKNVLSKSDTGEDKKTVNGSYPVQTLTSNNLTLHAVPEDIEDTVGNEVKESDCSNVQDESALQHMQFGWEKEHKKPTTVKSCKQVEIETTTYVKECIEHHQSLLM